MTRIRIRLLALLVVALGLVGAGCGGATGSSAQASLNPADWTAVLHAARGQTLNWYTYGGDDMLNSFVNSYVAGQMRADGIKLNQVKVTDTTDAVNKLLGEKQAGRTSNGSVDAIWINGDNFATGVQAHLWYCGYPKQLPNAKLVNFNLPEVANDFGMLVAGCESPWQSANSALVYNSAAMGPSDVASVSSLFSWVRAHPGHYTYSAPPDFTGSMAVRTFFYDTVGGPQKFLGPFNQTRYQPGAQRLWKRLNDIAPYLWMQGKTYPQAQPQVQQLFANGTIDAYLTYGPGKVTDLVAKGVYPKSTREAVLNIGNIANYSFISIPANSPHKAAALVLSNLLLAPEAQFQLFKIDGAYPGIQLSRAPASVQAQYASINGAPYVLPISALSAHALPELESKYVTTIDHDWKTNVEQK